MKKFFVICFAVLFLFGTSFSAFTKERVQIDVLYMNHGPLRPILRELDRLFSEYGTKITVYRHEFFSEEGKRFKAEKGIKEHVPLAIWIDGRSTVEVNGRPVLFNGFPTGSGPTFFQGKWDLDVLKEALDMVTGKD